MWHRASLSLLLQFDHVAEVFVEDGTLLELLLTTVALHHCFHAPPVVLVFVVALEVSRVLG